jgi:hypothetical protein
VGGRNYREPDVKKLFALSRHECAMDECHERLAHPSWDSVLGRICHIRGHSPGGRRYDPCYENVDAFANLILLCPTCHTKIDDLEPDVWTVDRLEEMKARHEAAAHEVVWASDDELDRYAAQATRQAQLDFRAAQLLASAEPLEADTLSAGTASGA